MTGVRTGTRPSRTSSSRCPPHFWGIVTRSASLKVIAWGKLTFDERVVVFLWEASAVWGVRGRRVRGLGACQGARPSPGANLKSIFYRCYIREVAFEWELTENPVSLPLGCLQGGLGGNVTKFAAHKALKLIAVRQVGF